MAKDIMELHAPYKHNVNTLKGWASVTQDVSFDGGSFIVKHEDADSGDYIAKFGNVNRGLVYLRTHTLSGDEYPSIMLVRQPAGWTIPAYPYGNYALYMSPNAITLYDSTGTVAGSLGINAAENMYLLAQTNKDFDIKITTAGKKFRILDEGSNEVASIDRDGKLTILGDAATKISVYNNDATPSEVFAVDNSGNIATSGTVDGVDIAAHAANGDAHHAETHLLPSHANVVLDIATPFNTAIGFTAGSSLTGSSLRNTAFGYEALVDNSASNENTAMGWKALKANTGANNVAVGSNCLAASVAGAETVAMGQGALYQSTAATQCVVIGRLGAGAVTGAISGLCGVGNQVFYGLTTGANNTAFGNLAGHDITTGGTNTFVGYMAGDNASQKVDADNSMALGNGTWTTASNQVVIGNTSVTTMILRGAVTMVIANGNAFPVTPNHGEPYYRNDLHKLYVYDNTLATPAWQEI
jgi:hypothetical protein